MKNYLSTFAIAGVLLGIIALIIVPQMTPSAASKEYTPQPTESRIAAIQPAAATPTLAPSFTATPSATPSVAPTGTPSGSEIVPVVNQATAQYQAALATANAIINGTNPTPGSSISSPPPAIVVPSNMVLVTATPTPKNIITVAAQAATATAVATQIGTYTPVPFNWVVPEIIIAPSATPVPANAATARYQAAEATARAFINGTPTPLPPYVWTATPTPFMRPVIAGDVATPYIPPTPTATPLPVPRALVGKIVFLSDRSGGPAPLATPLAYAINPDGSQLAVLADKTFYDTALMRDTFPANRQTHVFVKDVNGAPAIFLRDYPTGATTQLVAFSGGHGAWDPVLSPAGDKIAFVANASGDDEIWIVNRDGSGLKRLTATNEVYNARNIGKNTFVPEVNGHPSWSPDGRQILFWSNRTGHRQLWIMNADGSNERRLVANGYDDWNPVWVKYNTPPREIVLGIGAN